MNANEALALLEAVLSGNRLSTLQKTVFCHTWEDQSYLEIARRSGYELGYIKQTGSQLWQLLSQALDEKVTKHNVQQVVRQIGQQHQTPIAAAYSSSGLGTWVQATAPRPTLDYPEHLAAVPSRVAPREFSTTLAPVTSSAAKCDWGNAADVSTFYGRETELDTLKQWIWGDRCRLVGIFGMGGMGKTSLAVKLARELAGHQANSPPPSSPFQFVIWRSLRNAPPLLDLLADLIQFVSHQQQSLLPDSVDGRIWCLINYLRQHHCLIILDNGETVMPHRHRGDRYLSGCESYAQLWQCIGEAEHQSTLVLTSREKPKEIATQEGKALPIRSLRLTGLPVTAGQSLLGVKGDFSGGLSDWETLVEHYAGNPLALKMVAPVIQELFDGQIADFLDCLQEGTLVFSDIHDLLAQQITRLSWLEQQILYWLAIDRKPITLSQLRANFTPPLSLGQLLDALTSLERHDLIDRSPTVGLNKTQICFTLQPVVMEYITEQLIKQVCTEIWQLGQKESEGQKAKDKSQAAESKPHTQSLSSSHLAPAGSRPLPLLQTHALLQARAKDYIRETQLRLIVKPIAERLLQRYSLTELSDRCRQILGYLRQQPPQQMGYAAGNLINLLCQLGIDLTGWDFSELTVWNAYLRGVNLHDVDFTAADLAKSVFTETFSQILAVAFSPDGKLLATGDVNHEIHLWQVSDGRQLLSCQIEEGWVWSVTFSPDGRWLASSANRTVKLWDVQTGACVQTFGGYSDRVFSVAFSPDGRLLATGSEDHLVRLWDVRTGALVQVLSGHTDEVRSVSFSSVGLRLSPQSSSTMVLASASFDGTVRLWDAATGTCLKQFQGHQGWVWSVAFSPDGQVLASSGSDRLIHLWQVSTGTWLRSLLGHTQQIRTVAFSGDGKTLVSGSDDCTLRLWDYRQDTCLATLTGHSSWIASVAVSPENHLIASGSEDQSVRFWNSRSRLCLKTLQGYSNGVWSVAFSPLGSLLASGSQDRSIRLWDWQQGRLLGCLAGHSSWVWSVAFHPLGAELASGSEDGTVKLWDLSSQTLSQTLHGHDDAVLAVLFGSAGKTVLSGSLDGTIKQWHQPTGRCLQTLTGHLGGVWCLALSANGQWLVSGSQDQTIKLWDVEQGTCLQTLVGHAGWIRSVAIHPDRRTVVSGSADGVIKAWSLPDGRCHQTLAAHRGPVLSIAFHPSGQTFASCGTDGLIKLWDATTYRCLQTLEGHDRWVRFLCYSPDGQTLASCSQDETIKLWDYPSLHSRVLRVPRPYEGMAIGQVRNLTAAQVSTLCGLGAVKRG